MSDSPHTHRTAAEAAAAVEVAEQSNQPKRSSKDELETLCVNTIRFLAVDAVERAASGHPGTPMGMADMAFVLWTEFLRHDPSDPEWQNRDRFILSAGHASMLLYGLLHLTGYQEMTLEQLRNFRQWDSKTAGHPEYGHAAGIEVTTGPLGQGFANGIGMAIAERMMAARFNSKDFRPVDHFVYALCSDGDLMEGVASEAASLAGHLGLGNVIYLYDDNLITIEGETRLAFSEDVKKRFESYGWHVIRVDGHDRSALRRAIRRAQKATDRPSLLICRTVIGWGSPNMHGTAEVHGAPLGEEEVAATKKALDWPAEPHFHVPDAVREEFRRRTRKLARSRRKWEKTMKEWRKAKPELAALWDAFWSRNMPEGWTEDLLAAVKTTEPSATRSLSGKAIQTISRMVPFFAGGSADLGPSNNTAIKDSTSIAREDLIAGPPAIDVFGGRNLHFGVREHAMGAIVNGMTLYGSWRAYGGTFLIFSDYMRPSIRLAALMKVPSIFVFTHDSVFLGEDGPTHQPVEHLWALRAIPNLKVFRPADSVEVAMAWAWAMENRSSPVALSLTRQKLDPIPREDGDHEKVRRGAYVVSGYEEGELTFVATGSEVPLAVASAERLRDRGIAARVVSAPCLQLFDQQDESYRREVLGEDRGRLVALEAGATLGWYRYLDHDALVIGIDDFGHSAPWKVIAEKLGFTAEAVEAKVLAWWEAKRGE
jgi:transketolase